MSTTTKIPAGPPPLPKLGDRKKELEANRETRYAEWKEALVAAGGNVSRAAISYLFVDDGSPPEVLAAARTRARSHGKWLTREFQLADFAADLREKEGQHRGAGRPTGTTKTPASGKGSKSAARRRSPK